MSYGQGIRQDLLKKSMRIIDDKGANGKRGMKEKSIKKNMIMSVVLTSANFLFPLLTYSYVARVLTPAGTGRVAHANSILSYFSYIAILGIPAYGLREVAKVRDNKEKMSTLVQELLIINLISTFVAYFAFFLSVAFVPKLFSERHLFCVMAPYIILNTIGLDWVYQALEDYTYITIRSLFFKVIAVVLTFAWKMHWKEQEHLWLLVQMAL